MTIQKSKLNFTMTQEENTHREVTAELESQQETVEVEGLETGS